MPLTDIDAQRLGDSVADKLGDRNLIINGAMNVAQRGTSSTSAGFGTVDRFRTEVTSGTVTSSQQSLTTGSPYDEGFRNFYRLTNTTASSNNATGERAIRHMLEAQNLANSGWNYASSSSYVTLSFWVRASVSQEYYVYLRTRDGTSQRYAISIGTLTADTWTKITKTIPGNSNLTFNNDNGLGLELFFNAFQGTDSTDSGVSLNAWAAYASSTKLPDMTTTWSTTTNATFDLTGVQLEVGNTATPFEHRSFGDELVRCMRYFQKSYSYSDAPGSATSTGTAWLTVAQGGGRLAHTAYLKVKMRATPTLKTYDWSGNIDKIRTQAGDNQSASAIYSSANSVVVDVNAAGIQENIFQFTVESEL
tara:strand:+ start:367 stop:1455 length:1089 start_codon:yes stop_codon:yes gene_type:complete